MIQERFPEPTGKGRRKLLPISYILDQILFVLETHLEVNNASWKTVYHYFSLWSRANLFEKAYKHFMSWYTKMHGLSQELIVDTSFIKGVYGRDCVGPSPF